MVAMVAVDPYVLWTFFASLLGFVALSVLHRRNYGNGMAKDRSKVRMNKNNTNNSLVSEQCVKRSDEGEFRQVYGSGTDVIIVGAGVAGAALAHTLAKVRRKKNFHFFGVNFYPFFFLIA